MISRADFVPVTENNRHILEHYFAQYPQHHSESSIVTILTWKNYAPCSFTEHKNHLIIECTMDGERGIHSAIGKPDAELLEELLIFAREENCALEIYDEENLQILKDTHPKIPITENRGYFEYCYSTEELANLKGKKYLNIRGQINKFNSHWKYSVEKITDKNIHEVTKLIEEWSIEKHCETDEIMKEEINAVKYALGNYQNLPIDGIAIRIEEDKHLAGIAVWEIQNSESALIHFEKGLAQYPGIYKIINKETARKLLGKVKWINRESDMDVIGLRESKLRYHPEFFIKAYYILPQDIPATLS